MPCPVATIAVSNGRLLPLLYQSSVQAYEPGKHDATFLVAATPPGPAGDPAEGVPGGAVRATFGAPKHVYRFSGYAIDVWDVNLLTKLRK